MALAQSSFGNSGQGVRVNCRDLVFSARMQFYPLRCGRTLPLVESLGEALRGSSSPVELASPIATELDMLDTYRPKCQITFVDRIKMRAIAISYGRTLRSAGEPEEMSAPLNALSALAVLGSKMAVWELAGERTMVTSDEATRGLRTASLVAVASASENPRIWRTAIQLLANTTQTVLRECMGGYFNGRRYNDLVDSALREFANNAQIPDEKRKFANGLYVKTTGQTCAPL